MINELVFRMTGNDNLAVRSDFDGVTLEADALVCHSRVEKLVVTG